MNWYKLSQRDLGRRLPETGYEYRYVNIYRAMDAQSPTINEYDYVTRSMKFAKGHADHQATVTGETHIVRKARVPATTVFEAYNPGEYFYEGQPIEGNIVYETTGLTE